MATATSAGAKSFLVMLEWENEACFGFSDGAQLFLLIAFHFRSLNDGKFLIKGSEPGCEPPSLVDVRWRQSATFFY